MQQEKRAETSSEQNRIPIGVVPLQAAMVAVLVATVLFCRSVLPGVYQKIEESYVNTFAEQNLMPELVRFANAALDYLAMPVSAENTAPAGASNQTYVPEQAYVQPAAGYTLSSGYGWRKHPVTEKKTYHKGVDLACAEGTPVYAVMDGLVEYTLYSESGGNSVRLRHANGVETAYCHMQYAFVRAGEEVSAGQLIGTAGATGNATGPHLHFSLLYNDCYYDPSEMLKLES